jgi:hypothetical protein
LLLEEVKDRTVERRLVRQPLAAVRLLRQVVRLGMVGVCSMRRPPASCPSSSTSPAAAEGGTTGDAADQTTIPRLIRCNAVANRRAGRPGDSALLRISAHAGLHPTQRPGELHRRRPITQITCHDNRAGRQEAHQQRRGCDGAAQGLSHREVRGRRDCAAGETWPFDEPKTMETSGCGDVMNACGRCMGHTSWVIPLC